MVRNDKILEAPKSDRLGAQLSTPAVLICIEGMSFAAKI